MKKKELLIVEDDPTLASVLSIRCGQLGLEIRVAENAVQAVTMMGDKRPDLILLDLEMPLKAGDAATHEGLVICEKLKHSVLSDVPVIVLSGCEDREIISRCRLAGAVFIRKTPEAWDKLKAEIVRLLNLEPNAESGRGPGSLPRFSGDTEIPPHAPKILCVDDDPDINLAVGMRLRQLGAYPIRAFSGTQGFQKALEDKPDLVLTDLHMPDGDGNHLISRLKSNPMTRDIPVVVLTAVCNPGVARDLRLHGADGYLTKPLDIPTVIAELSRFIKLPNL